MKTYSLEYCHVTPDTNWEKEIKEVNTHAPRILEMYKDFEMQKCIMIDDLHTKVPVSSDFISKIVEGLTVKPDCIYLESSFVVPAGNLITSIDPSIAASTTTEEQTWLKKVHDQYQSVNDFVVSWQKGDGTVMFSCPTLVAASYVYRLGQIHTKIDSVYGQEIKKADYLINLLSSKYLQVEANAQLIIKATHPKTEEKITWHFY